MAWCVFWKERSGCRVEGGGQGGRLGRKPRREALQTPGDMSTRLEKQLQAGRSDASEAESRVPCGCWGVKVSPAAPGLDSE